VVIGQIANCAARPHGLPFTQAQPPH